MSRAWKLFYGGIACEVVAFVCYFIVAFSGDVLADLSRLMMVTFFGGVVLLLAASSANGTQRKRIPSAHKLYKLRLSLEADLPAGMLISTDLASKTTVSCKCMISYQGNIGEFDAKKIAGRWQVGKQTEHGFIPIAEIEQPEWLYHFDDSEIITIEQWCQLERHYSA